MIRHVVLYKLKDPSAQGRQAVKDTLMSLQGKIEVLRSIEVGFDGLGSERSFDVCLVCTFDSLADLHVYAEHPIHLPVRAYMKTATEKSVSCDYNF